ncbi:MAG: methyltransferase domain-containing protein [Verrucomicrobiales bacterium]|nr:methyltransferase domain-containing protein [Verrucomicrobiales bacterium]
MPNSDHDHTAHRVRPLVKDLVDRPTEAAHSAIRDHVNAGDTVVDATLGNGHDTLFLAELVGSQGAVHGFDIQLEALQSVQQKLEDEKLPQIQLHHLGHEKMESVLPQQVQAVMFNLGYLPGGDKQVITSAHSTIAALQAALRLLSAKGIVTIVAYIGHPGGQEEADAVMNFCQTLDDKNFAVTLHQSSSKNPLAPFLITIERV